MAGKKRIEEDTVDRIRILFGGMLAFALVIGCWALWGLITPGDFFANGNLLLEPTLCAAVALGAWIGFKARSLWLRGLVVVAAVGALCFLVIVPDGWWVTPPG